MKFYSSFFFFILLVLLYSACKKEDVADTKPKLSIVNDTTSLLKMHPKIHLTLAENVVGRYVVSGSTSTCSYNGYSGNISNDTITITACGDSSIRANLTKLGSNVDWGLCINYPPTTYGHFSNYCNYRFDIQFEHYYIEVYFPANHLDSIYIYGSWFSCDTGPEPVTLIGTRIR
jgi:hypothetical protein